MREPDLIQTLPAADITTLRLHVVSADICIQAHRRDDIRVIASGIHEYAQILPTLTHTGEVLRLDGETESALSQLHQQARLKLTVHIPAELSVTVRMLAGTLQLNGAFDQFDARVRFGSVTGCAPARRVKIRLFAGDVRLGGLTGAVDMQLSLGDLTLAWASLRAGEMVQARSFAGDTHLDLPDHIVLTDGRAVIQAHPHRHGKRATATLNASPQIL